MTKDKDAVFSGLMEMIERRKNERRAANDNKRVIAERRTGDRRLMTKQLSFLGGLIKYSHEEWR